MHRLHLLLQRLVDAELEFVVVGGYAAVIHGSAYVTQDLDVCCVFSAGNMAKIAAALEDLNPLNRDIGDRMTARMYQTEIERLPAGLRLKTDSGMLDIVGSILGVGDLERLKERAVKVSLFGRTCAVISLDDLIAAKLAVGRERDLLAVKELRAIAAKRAQNGDIA